MSSNSTLSLTETSNSLYTLKSYLRNKHDADSFLLQLEDNSFSVLGKQSDVQNKSVKFLLDRLSLSGDRLAYRFRPEEQSEKYITVSGNDLVLMSSDKTEEKYYTFIVDKRSDTWQRFQVLSSVFSTPLYIVAHDNGKVTVEEDDGLGKSWFHVKFAGEASSNKTTAPSTSEEVVIFILESLEIRTDEKTTEIVTTGEIVTTEDNGTEIVGTDEEIREFLTREVNVTEFSSTEEETKTIVSQEGNLTEIAETEGETVEILTTNDFTSEILMTNELSTKALLIEAPEE